MRTAAAPRASSAVTHLMLRTKSREDHKSLVLHTHTFARAHFGSVPVYNASFFTIQRETRVVPLQDKKKKKNDEGRNGHLG